MVVGILLLQIFLVWFRRRMAVENIWPRHQLCDLEISSSLERLKIKVSLNERTCVERNVLWWNRLTWISLSKF
jgi:hypothetical protein